MEAPVSKVYISQNYASNMPRHFYTDSHRLVAEDYPCDLETKGAMLAFCCLRSWGRGGEELAGVGWMRSHPGTRTQVMIGTARP